MKPLSALLALALAACPGQTHTAKVEPTRPPPGPVDAGVEPDAAPRRPKLLAAVRKGFTELGRLKRVPCDVYDYFPQGGIRAFYCHLRPLVDYRTVQKLSGVAVFSKLGPHTAQKTNSGDRSRFGHYNKDFVIWLRKAIAPISMDAAFRRATQLVYDKYIRFLARQFHMSYAKLLKNPEYLRGQTKRYRRLTAAGKLPRGDYEQWFFFMNPHFLDEPRPSDSYFWKHGRDGDGADGNVIKSCVAWWLRRTIDGTAGAFFEGLETLLKTYDESYLAGASKPSRP